MPCQLPSLPRPDSLRPPNGASGLTISTSLMPIRFNVRDGQLRCESDRLDLRPIPLDQAKEGYNGAYITPSRGEKNYKAHMRLSGNSFRHVIWTPDFELVWMRTSKQSKFRGSKSDSGAPLSAIPKYWLPHGFL